MKKFYPLMLLLIAQVTTSQSITVDNTTNTPAQLVKLLLGNSCTTTSNISISSNESTAYFNQNGSNFPIKEGVIIRNGIAKQSEGKYTGNNLSSQLNSNSDASLQQISNNNGQNTPIQDIAFLEFDFVPLSNNFNFNFLFASNEYGEFQCGYSDVFAFLLTDLVTNTTTNLAVVPGTNDPVSVKNIRDSRYNASCSSVNANLFGTYNLTDPANSVINMKGYTQVLNAAATVIPNRSYRIRLVIGDAYDSNYDSAVFLSSGSFKTSIDLGADQTICAGNTTTIKTGLTDAKYIHTWKRNGLVLANETNNTLTVKAPGTYEVAIREAGTSCEINDEIVFETLNPKKPQDLRACQSESAIQNYNLTQNNLKALDLNADIYSLSYYNTLTDATKNTNPIIGANLTKYSSPGNETIYIKINNKTNTEICDAIYTFNLIIDAPAAPKSPGKVNICDNPEGNTVVLSNYNLEILDGKIINDYSITYHATVTDANNKTNILPAEYFVAAGPKTVTVWVRMNSTINKDCFSLTSFDIVVNALPKVDAHNHVIKCSQYVLPAIVNGNYFSESQGQGTPFFAGDTLTKSGQYYIYIKSETTGCSNENSFKVTFVNNYKVEKNHCGVYVVQRPPAGSFFSEPNGQGNWIKTNSEIRENMSLYYYTVIDDKLCQNTEFPLNIIPLPVIDKPENVITCSSYTLPKLTNGDYYATINNVLTKVQAGYKITSTQAVHVYKDNNPCTSRWIFKVTIVPTPKDVVACGSYVLPMLETGGYFTEPAGKGVQFAAGSTIKESTTLYVFTKTTTTPNCTDNNSFRITIKPIPAVDQSENILRCINDTYSLPALTNGNYFTAKNRAGTQLNATNQITKTQTIYINNLVNGCQNESSFTVEVRDFPKLTILTDVTTCAAYSIPNVSNGVFYTESQRKGQVVEPGTSIENSQVMFVYSAWPDLTSCFVENKITINYLGVKVTKIQDAKACDQYRLPALEVGEYYTQSRGNGTKLQAGDLIKTSQKIYVYAKKGSRFTCDDEHAFTVAITKTPTIATLSNIEVCDFYTLPTLAVGNYFSKENGQGTQYFAGDQITKNQTMYVFAKASSNADCFDQKSFSIIVHPLKEIKIAPAVVCVDFKTGKALSTVTLKSGLDENKFTVGWYLNGTLKATGSNYTTSEIGEYEVIILKNTPEVGDDCGYKAATATVLKSSPAIATAAASSSFDDRIDVIVSNLQGFGEYIYQTNQNGFQSSNTFTDVASGDQTIIVRDTKGGCADLTLKINVLKHPKYFTPNNDGVNDRWNIAELANEQSAEICIYNRYGSLLKTIKPSGLGWDGKLNNQDLPEDDYWFKVKYPMGEETKEYASNFSLKRN